MPFFKNGEKAAEGTVLSACDGTCCPARSDCRSSDLPLIDWLHGTRQRRNTGSSDETVWIYVDTSKEVGDVHHLKVFANADASDRWCADHDPEGVAFEYPVEE